MAKKNVGAAPSNPTDVVTVSTLQQRFILGAVGVAQPPAGTPWGLYLPLASS